MDSEEGSDFFEFETYAVGCIDFGASRPAVAADTLRSFTVFADIEKDKDCDKRIYLLHRFPKEDPPGSHSDATDHPENVRLVEKRVRDATWLLSERPLPEQLVFLDEDNSSGPSHVVVVQTAQDGPETSDYELQVVPAERLIYGPGEYPMVSSPRGMCIIINNCNFECYDEPRYGSELDVSRMEALFKAFLFKCIVHIDKKADEMKKLLSEAAQSKEQEGADCLVVILMSHGNQDTIQGVDGEELHLINSVYAQFNDEKCPALKGKPKLFFIQACRGDDWDNGTYVKVGASSDAAPLAADAPLSSSLLRQKSIMTWSDMYIAYAAVLRYRSYRNLEEGSWFLSAVYKVFSKHAGTMHLGKLMERVHDEVLEKSTDDGERQTPVVETLGWKKELYFNPKKFLDSAPEETVSNSAL
ncbi:hypothetical protein HPB52_014301 [Rhipicephalus sanguineus]|uniref:Caspase-2 n=1 Tax=Rhipicephalus sanguineus TaxID=34632 RepID=A0A9D4PJR3_RHISA|nr:hypothetical protein HPB52_014301 [Rhipicephalus sanguineus]